MLKQLLNPIRDEMATTTTTATTTLTSSTTSISSNSKVAKTITSKQGKKHSAKFQRTSNGCLTCRRKKKKCDGLKPVCSRCQKSGHDCVPPPTRFFKCDIKGFKQTYTEIKTAQCVSNSNSNSSSSSSESVMSTPNGSPRSSVSSLCSSPSRMPHNSSISSSTTDYDYDMILQDLNLTRKTSVLMHYHLPLISHSLQPPVPNSCILQSIYIKDTLVNQKLVPSSVMNNLHNIAMENMQVLTALDCYCCNYISNNEQLSLKYSHIDFNSRSKELTYKLSQIEAEIGQFGYSADVQISFYCLLLLIDNYKTKGFNSFTKHLPKIKTLLNNNESSVSTILKFLQYFEMTTTVVFGNEQLIKGDFKSKSSLPTVDCLELVIPIIQIYSKIFTLSRSLRKSQVIDDDINSVLLDAAYWERKLDSLHPADVSTISEECNLLFDLYKFVGKLLVYQLIYKMQSSSTKTILLIMLIRSIILKLLEKPMPHFDSCLLVYPMFIAGVDVFGAEVREEYFKAFEKLVKDDLKNPSCVTILVILKEIWKLNPDGFSYVDWVRTGSDYFFAIN